ncbi:MAG: RNA polymerase sigma factor [Anaerolineae bacterium]|nr:RNA polymerase sigma factor [Anaerolineae bacterium]
MNLQKIGQDEPTESDASLVRRAQRGDANAVGELYDRHHTLILRYLWSRTGDLDLAEDLSGEVFERMITGLPRYRSTGTPFKAWLYRIAHNLAVDHIRKASRYNQVPLDQVDSSLQQGHSLMPIYQAPMPEKQIEAQLTAERVQNALQKLDPLQQNVVILRFLVGFSLQEVAVTLGKSVPAIKSLQHRGLSALRTALQED